MGATRGAESGRQGWCPWRANYYFRAHDRIPRGAWVDRKKVRAVMSPLMLAPPRRVNWWRLGWLLGLLMIGSWAVSLIGVIFWEHRDMARPASAIVVLGAA